MSNIKSDSEVSDEVKRRRKHSYGWRKATKSHPEIPLYHPMIDKINLPKEKNIFSRFWAFLLSLFTHTPIPTPTPPTPPDNTVVDLRSQDSPIEDQGQLGSCTANAFAGALQFLELKDGYTKESTGALNFSRLFIYYNERVIEGSVNTDSGAELSDGVTTLGQQGACYETTWPYDISQFANQPVSTAYSEAANHKVTTVYSINQDINDLKACLSAGYPFVFGFTVYDSFESATVESTGIVPMPGPLDYVIGGHAVMCLGFNDSTQRFICRNSWGTGFGEAGYFEIPYAYLTNSNLANEFYTIRVGTGM